MKNADVVPRPGGRTALVTGKIEKVTLEILIEKGYDGLTFKEVAEAAKINRSTLYRRWPSRAALVLAVIQKVVRENVVFEDTGSLVGDLRAVMLRIGTFIQSPMGKNVLIAGLDMQQKGELEFDDGLSWAERAKDVMPIFDRAIARGELQRNFDGEAAFAMVAGALYFRLIVMRGEPNKTWVDRVLQLFSNMNLAEGRNK